MDILLFIICSIILLVIFAAIIAAGLFTWVLFIKWAPVLCGFIWGGMAIYYEQGIIGFLIIISGFVGLFKWIDYDYDISPLHGNDGSIGSSFIKQTLRGLKLFIALYYPAIIGINLGLYLYSYCYGCVWGTLLVIPGYVWQVIHLKNMKKRVELDNI